MQNATPLTDAPSLWMGLFLHGSEDLTVGIGLTLCYYNIARKKGGEKVAKKKKKVKKETAKIRRNSNRSHLRSDC